MVERKKNSELKTYLSALFILFVLMLVSGIITRIIPTGMYQRVIIDGVEKIIPNSFKWTNEEALPIWKWVLAPIIQLGSNGSTMIIVISLFLLVIGGAIHVLNVTNTIQALIQLIIKKFGNNKKLLIASIVFTFMSLGAFLGIFEEVVPLVPFMIVLATSLGYDALTGLGISILATGFGFSAAITNPFTIGVAQKLADVPLFSGALYRFIVFIIVYIVLLLFLFRYTSKIEKAPNNSVSIELTKLDRIHVSILIGGIGTLFISLVLTSLLNLTDYNLILIGLFFFVIALCVAVVSRYSIFKTMRIYVEGALQLSPAILLVLMASSIKYIISEGHILDSILYYFSGSIKNIEPIVALLILYMLVLSLEFFIGSGSAKAFIVIPIIAPLVDLLGISRQLSILAFQFGDGFSNVLYPTNAVLLMALGFAKISYTTWFKWIFKLQVLILIITSLLLYIGLQIRY